MSRPGFKRNFSRLAKSAETAPLQAVVKLAQRTQNNLRQWYTRKHRAPDPPNKDTRAEVAKSESLFTQVFLITPMVLLAASGIQLQDTDERRVPVLLQQLSFSVADHGKFLRIRVEYGAGEGKFTWEIQRTNRDLLLFRAKLKTHRRNPRANVPKLPKFKHGPEDYALRVAEWLAAVARAYMLRPDSNDFLQFIELSRLSVALAREYTFHGKEGALFIRSRASEMGWKVGHLHPHDFRDMIKRHTRKWVIIRDSFIVIVNGIGSTRIRDVFMVDKHFKVKHLETANELETASVSSLATSVASSSSSSSSSSSDTSQALTEPRSTAVGTNTAMGNVKTPKLDGELDLSGPKSKHVPLVFLHLENSSRELKLAGTSEHEIQRWQQSLLGLQSKCSYAKQHRFDSFAPIRQNVLAQWFVDGRDYMWVLSEALEHAQDTIYILDWWLSPELYLRRPAEGNQHFRLDRLLKRKASQGVKIFVIVYRNVGPTIPNDSMWTKHSLLDLHPNIHVMRSPNQLQNKSALFWAHHEKVCVVDQTVAFCGGVDLCYGRWDTWEHVATDDLPLKFTTTDEPTQLFVGKEYGNERASDFHDLDKPYEDMFDRTRTPRMPWHDVHQMVVGQPARDLARHFTQRWNYCLRQKTPSRLTPLLLPPPEFTNLELERLQLVGTCEYQVCRSSGEWSLGLKEPERSIQNAYIKLICESNHFIYIENQFFITSTVVDGIRIENEIGDAIVQRIIRAHERKEKWKAFIIIPLLPGFAADVGSEKASSVRVICQCQFNSISRGPDSVFYRLERRGIRPEEYIRFFSLRKWGKFKDDKLITELLYVHGKTMIVDDRIAVIGSANINERSMRGSRDSEIAVVIRDTQVVKSTMDGKEYNAAKFAHTLRTRLMREHLGVDIDAFDVTERILDAMETHPSEGKDTNAQDVTVLDEHLEEHLNDTLETIEVNDNENSNNEQDSEPVQVTPPTSADNQPSRPGSPDMSNTNFTTTSKILLEDRRAMKITEGNNKDGKTAKSRSSKSIKSAKSSASKPTSKQPDNPEFITSSQTGNRATIQALDQDIEDLDHADKQGELSYRHSFNWLAGTNANLGVRDYKKVSKDSRIQMNAEHRADVDGYGLDEYAKRTAQALADKQTFASSSDFSLENRARQIALELVKDPQITSKHQFRLALYARLTDSDPSRPVKKAADLPAPQTSEDGLHALNSDSIPIDPWGFADPLDTHFLEDKWIAAAERNTLIYRLVFRCQPDDEVETWKDYKTFSAHQERFMASQNSDQNEEFVEHELPSSTHRNRRWANFDKVLNRDVAEDLLRGLTGNLVVFPTEWLNRELESGNWNFQLDRIPPLEIYD